MIHCFVFSYRGWGITLCYLQNSVVVNLKTVVFLHRMGNNNSLLPPHSFEAENTFPHLTNNDSGRSPSTSLHLCNRVTLHVFEKQLYEGRGDVLQLFGGMLHHGLRVLLPTTAPCLTPTGSAKSACAFVSLNSRP